MRRVDIGLYLVLVRGCLLALLLGVSPAVLRGPYAVLGIELRLDACGQMPLPLYYLFSFCFVLLLLLVKGDWITSSSAWGLLLDLHSGIIPGIALLTIWSLTLG